MQTSVVSGTEIFSSPCLNAAHIKPKISIMPVSKVGPTRGYMLLKYLHPKYFPNFLTATTLQAAMLCDYQ